MVTLYSQITELSKSLLLQRQCTFEACKTTAIRVFVNDSVVKHDGTEIQQPYVRFFRYRAPSETIPKGA